jgi:hypothetical protein
LTLAVFFMGATFLLAICLFFVFSLVAMRAVYHRSVIHGARPLAIDTQSIIADSFCL